MKSTAAAPDDDQISAGWFRADFRQWTLSLGLLLVSSVSAMAMLVLLSNIVGDPTGPLRDRILLSALFLIVSGVTAYFSQFVMAHAGQRFAHRIRRLLADSTVNCGLQAFERIGAAAVTTALTRDLPSTLQGLAAIPQLLLSIVIFAASGVYIATLSPTVAIALLAVVVVTSVCVALANRLVRRYIIAAREKEEQYRELSRDIAHGLRELKLHPARTALLVDEKENALSQDISSTSVRQISIQVMTDEVFKAIFFLFLLSSVAIVAVLGRDAGSVAPIVLVLLFMNTSYIGVVTGLRALNLGAVSLERLKAVIGDLNSGSEAPSRNQGPNPLTQWNTISVADLSFEYAEASREFTIGPLNLTIRRGEIIFLRGANGSGKTSIAKLLCALYTANQGKILIDGEPLSGEQLVHYRDLFSISLADRHLFTSLAPAQLPGGTSVANLLNDVGLPQNTVAGDLSCAPGQLSKGQQDRLALLDVLLQGKTAVILDEWAAHQDSARRAWYYEEFLPQLKAAGVTVIAISHDDHPMGLADQIWIVEDGKVRDETLAGSIRSEVLQPG